MMNYVFLILSQIPMYPTGATVQLLVGHWFCVLTGHLVDSNESLAFHSMPGINGTLTPSVSSFVWRKWEMGECPTEHVGFFAYLGVRTNYLDLAFLPDKIFSNFLTE